MRARVIAQGLTWTLKFEPRDVWVGVYWDWRGATKYMLDIYVCLIPCFPLKVTVMRHDA